MRGDRVRGYSAAMSAAGLDEVSRVVPSGFAYEDARRAALQLLSDTSATKVTLPFVEEQLQAARETMGEDFWSYGVGPARRTLEAFVRAHHAQGLSSREVPVEELFHPATYETYSI